MSFDKIFDLTAGVYFNFYDVDYCRMSSRTMYVQNYTTQVELFVRFIGRYTTQDIPRDMRHLTGCSVGGSIWYFMCGIIHGMCPVYYGISDEKRTYMVPWYLT